MMKRIVCFSTAALLASAVLTLTPSCGRGAGSADSDAIDNFKVEQTIKSTQRCFRGEAFGDTLYLSATTSMQWPDRFGTFDIGALQRHLIATAYGAASTLNIDSAMRAFVATPDSIIGDSTAFVEIDSVPALSASFQSYEAEITTRLTAMSEQLVSYEVLASSYLGGAHPNTVITPFTYIFDLGEVMTYERLFKPGTEAEVAKVVNEAAADQYGVRPYRLSAKGFFSDTLAVSHDVALNNGAIVFHYNPYDVAPYAAGMIDIEVYPYMVSDYLTAPYRRLFDL